MKKSRNSLLGILNEKIGDNGKEACEFCLPELNDFYPWCMAFVSLMMIKYCNIKDFPKTTSCTQFFNSSFAQSRKNQSYETAEVGDIIEYNWDTDNTPDHIGIVIDRTGDTIKVIEGNYGDKPSNLTTVGVRTFSITDYRRRGLLHCIIDMSEFFTDEPIDEEIKENDKTIALMEIRKHLQDIVNLFDKLV